MAGPERLSRAFEQAMSASLKVRCLDCRHTGSMPRAQALDTFGGVATVLQVIRRLRCSACRSKHCEAWI